jgi:hypothetical protein
MALALILSLSKGEGVALIVIPAKAGIQGLWTPALAGVTDCGRQHTATVHKRVYRGFVSGAFSARSLPCKRPG